MTYYTVGVLVVTGAALALGESVRMAGLVMAVVLVIGMGLRAVGWLS